MTSVLELSARAHERSQARWMPVTAAEFGVLADIAKCVTVVEDMLIVFCGYESCPHPAGCPTAFRCSELEACLGRVAARCVNSRVQ